SEAMARAVLVPALAPMVLAITVAAAGLTGAGCRKQGLADQEQIGATVGELMASLDESTKGSGATARLPILRMPDELKGPVWRQVFDGVVRTAYAGSCVQSTFATCTAGARTRTFDNCAIGPATLDGMVILTFSDTNSCAVAVAGDSVNRSASFTLTGPYGGAPGGRPPGGGETADKNP